MSKNKLTILVVDNHPAARSALVGLLQRLGYRTAEAPSGEEALALVSAVTFQAIFLDITMPRMSGLEVLAHFKSN